MKVISKVKWNNTNKMSIQHYRISSGYFHMLMAGLFMVLFPLTFYGQQNQTLNRDHNEQVTIVGTYDPSINQAFKINTRPEINNVSIEKPVFTFTSLEIKLWKDMKDAESIQGAGDVEETAKELYAEVYRISLFQAAKLAHLRVLAGIERNLAEKGLGEHHWDKAEDYLNKFYSALKERVA